MNNSNIKHLDQYSKKCINVFDELEEMTNYITNHRYLISETDIYNDFNTFIPVPPSSPESVENPIYTELMITSKSDNTLYVIPSIKSIDARKIWIEAGIPEVATISDIEYYLIEWAYNLNYLEIKDNIIVSITWKISNNSCNSTWHTFLRWMICACYRDI